MKRALLWEQIMALDETAIREAFPHGAVVTGQKKDRWRPATEAKEANRSLKRLLKEKKATVQRPRLLHRDSSRGYTEEPAMAMSPDAGEAVDKETQEHFAKEGMEHFGVVHAEERTRAEIRSYLARLRKLALDRAKAGGDPRPVFEAAVKAMEDEPNGSRKAA